MNYVEPIRDNNKIHEMMSFLKDKSERNYILFMIGIYTGLRISDILKLRVRQVRNKSQVTLREQKTGKQRIIKLNPELKKALKEYCQDKEGKEFLVKSRKGYNSPIGRVQAYKVVNAAADYVGLCNVGCHTMRKTFGYHFYKQTSDIATLMQILNHDHPSITMRYIGINQEVIDDAVLNFKI
jgi:integrase